jgi:hypothetical protein
MEGTVNYGGGPMKHVMIVMALLVILVLQTSMAHGAMQPPIPSPPSFPEPGGPPSLGAIDDSIANRLTIGMSDSEVFAFAGPPKFPVRELTMASRWVYVVGDDLLELTFGSGQIVQVKRFRQPIGGTGQ